MLPVKPPVKIDAIIIAALITAAATIIAAVIGVVLHNSTRDQPTAIVATPTTKTALVPTQSTTTNTPVSTATPSTIVTSISPTGYAFDFENGTQNWSTSEGSYKLATVDLTTNPVHSGSHALKITTALLGDANPAYTANKEVYRHTEATVYFSQAAPNGFDAPGPYNLAGKRVSCYVYLPSGLANGGAQQAYIRIFVKDVNFHDDFSTAVTIDQTTVSHWLLLSFIVGSDPNNADSGFDATKVNAMGVRVDTPSGSTLNYTFSIVMEEANVFANFYQSSPFSFI